MSNILFALYHHFGANSAVHVHNFANQLAERGHDVAVAIPTAEQTGAALGEQQYTVVTFDEIVGEWRELFGNGEPPEILHAWTPRENVRLFCEKVRGICEPSLFVHLEDNEEFILAKNLGATFKELAASDSPKIPANLSHPKKYREFIASADGVTVIIDTLSEFVPEGMPTLVLAPGADRTLFYPRARDEEFLIRHGVAPTNVILCYSGNVHSANAREVRSLYVAATILSREDIPTTLVRAGEDYCPFLGPDDEWARKISVSLGYVKHVEVPRVLALADFLIQPGMDDEFNRYRLPAKLPEFFAMGRPVILPQTNVGRFARDGEDAVVLPKVDALTIFDAVKRLRDDRLQRERLAQGALRFCSEHFDWQKNGDLLEGFYREIAKPRHETGSPVGVS